MKKITLDFTGCKYIGELHKVLKEALNFPDYYGENLDALWDCMRYSRGISAEIYIKGLSTLPKSLNDYAEKILEVFDDVHNENTDITFTILS